MAGWHEGRFATDRTVIQRRSATKPTEQQSVAFAPTVSAAVIALAAGKGAAQKMPLRRLM